MDLSRAAWTDVAAADADLAVLPVGSTEQHGPHAPLGTDVATAEAVAAAGVETYEESTDDRVLLAPAIPVGIAEEHRDFDGTLWVSPDTFRAYVREVVESLAHHGVSRVVLVNGHGGNTDALFETAARLSRDGTAYTVAFTWFDAVDTDLAMGHSGARETSLLLEVAPEDVREDRIDEAGADAAESWGEWEHGVALAYDSSDFSENGVVGDPREASAEAGAALLDDAAGKLTDLLGTVRDRSLDD